MAADDVSYDTGDLKGKPVPGLIKVGNIDLNHRPQVKNDDGSSSTIFSVTVPINRDGSVWKGAYEKAPQYALVPSIVNGKFLTSSGKMPPKGDAKAAQRLEDASTDHYAESRQHLGIFSSSDAAEKYTDQSHAYGNDGTDRKVYTPSMSTPKELPKGKSVPMISPSGKAIMVPEGHVDELLADGGSRAVKMTKDGSSPRWVPEGHVEELLQQPGVKLSPDNDPDTLDKFDTSRNDIQKSFDRNTRTNPSEPLLETGLKSVVHGAGAPFIHPIETGKALLRTIESPVPAAQMALDAARGIKSDYDEGGAGYAATKAAGETFGGLAAGEATGAAVGPVVRGVGKVPIPIRGFGANVGDIAAAAGDAVRHPSQIPSALRAARDKFVNTTYPQNAALSPTEAAGQEFAKTFNLPAGEAGLKRFQQIKDAAGEVGHVLAHGEKNGIPINGKLDFSKAAGSAAKEVQGHITDKLYGPHSGKIQAVPEGYGGKTMGGNGKASLGQIQDRINDIREALNDKNRTSGLSDQELKAERNALTRITHEAIGKFNQMTPESVAEIEARAGKLRTLEKETRAAANRDSVTGGRQDVGRSGIASVGRMGEEALQKLGGGPEVIGNRVFKDALEKFTPQEKPLPQPPPPDPSMPNTPEAAQAEFLRSHELEQSSQDASAARNAEANRLRTQNVDTQKSIAQREAVRAAELEGTSQDAAVGRNQTAEQLRAENVERQRQLAQQEAAHAVTLDNAAQDASAGRSDTANAQRVRNMAGDDIATHAKTWREFEEARRLREQNADIAAKKARDEASAQFQAAQNTPAPAAPSPIEIEASAPESATLPENPEGQTPPAMSAPPALAPNELGDYKPEYTERAATINMDDVRKHPSGVVTGIDEDSGLPIVKRAAKGSDAKTSDSAGPSKAAGDGKDTPIAPEGSEGGPTPDTHVFSKAQFKAANPDADADAAAKAAADEGFEVGP